MIDVCIITITDHTSTPCGQAISTPLHVKDGTGFIIGSSSINFYSEVLLSQDGNCNKI